MNGSSQTPQNLRDRGLEFLKKGKDMWNEHKDFLYREKGYEIYKKGLSYMVDYAKKETDNSYKAKITENLSTWMKEAKAMEATIIEERGKLDAETAGLTKSISDPTPNSNKGSSSDNKGGSKDEEGKDNKTKETKKIKETKGDDENDKLMENLKSAIVTEKPNIKWEDIAGLEGAKKALQEAVILPIKFPQLFVGMRTPWKGILLYGPPGTGKTYLAKACATEADGTFFSISSSDVISKYVGESERLIKTLFKLARESKPAIIFIDEIDSMLSARSDNENEATRRVKTEFLVQMQGVGHDDTGILVLGATNIPWALDSAVRRRFEKRIYIPLPDQPAREALLRKQLGKTPNSIAEEDMEYLAERTDGYSCADMNILIRDACFQPLRKCQNATHFKIVGKNNKGDPIYEPCAPSEYGAVKKSMLEISGDQLTLPKVALDDFETALLKTKPSVSQNDLKEHVEFTKNFGVEG